MKRLITPVLSAALTACGATEVSTETLEAAEPIRSELNVEETRTPLTIVSWNIANLAESPGKMLRGGYQRSEQDFDYLRAKITEMNADVIAFQEIGSSTGLENILDLDRYAYAFETRCLENESACRSDVGDIYTAIAYRRDLVDATMFQLDQLAIVHKDECGEERPVRGGVGVKFTHNGETVHVPSVHLKASCKDDRIEPGTEDDCATQRAQTETLLAWVASVPIEDTVVLAGDFNRKLLDEKDSIRVFMDSASGDERFSYLPGKEERACWSRDDYSFDFRALSAEARQNNPELDRQNVTPQLYTGRSNQEIDFFVVRGDLSAKIEMADQIELSGAYRFENPGGTLTQCDGETILKFEGQDRGLVFGESYPSDHCPIVLEVR